MELLAIRLGCQKTTAKSLVMRAIVFSFASRARSYKVLIISVQLHQSVY